jgi:hypothetical protein
MKSLIGYTGPWGFDQDQFTRGRADGMEAELIFWCGSER